MKNTHIILIAFLLFNCADNNIAPTSPDQDAASKKKDYYQFLANQSPIKQYLDLKEKNFYLDDSYYYKSKNGDIRNYKILLITDGYVVFDAENSNSHWYEGSTYMAFIVLYSAPNTPVESSDFLLPKIPKLTDDDYGTGLWYLNEPIAYFSVITSTGTIYHNSLEKVPAYSNGKNEYLKIQGKVTDGKMVKITVDNVDSFLLNEPWDDDMSENAFALGKGSISFTGSIKDVTFKHDDYPNGRISGNPDHMTMIMKRFNKLIK